VDNCNITGNPVAARICKQLHDGRLYPYPAGACRYRSTGQSHSGTESHVISGISEAKSTITRIECFPSWGTHHGIPAKAGIRFGGAAMQIQALPGMRDRLRKNRRTFSLPPIVEAIELAIGIVLLGVGIKKVEN
jgi:hypothetical protein